MSISQYVYNKCMGHSASITHITGAPNDNFRKNICSEDDLTISGAFFLAKIFEKVSFDLYNFRIT